MRKLLKRIQLIHRTKDGKCRKFWQTIDFERMITLEQVWNNIHQQLTSSSSNNRHLFSHYRTQQSLPAWYHVDLLNDNDQILIDEVTESAPPNKTAVPIVSINSECLRIIPKKKQLNAFITNRSFLITNKHVVPKDFYRQWEDGKLHKNTNNSRMTF